MVTKLGELWADFLTLISWKGGEIRWLRQQLWAIIVWLSRIPSWVIHVAVPAVVQAVVATVLWLIGAIGWSIRNIPTFIRAIGTLIRVLLITDWFLLPGVVVLAALDISIKLLGSARVWPHKLLGIAAIIIVLWIYWNVLGVSLRRFMSKNDDAEDEADEDTAKTCLAVSALLMVGEFIIYGAIAGSYLLFSVDPVMGILAGTMALLLLISTLPHILAAILLT